ncbi:MAG: polynucleotide adenylyltransferase PcnB [Betaproteobacteria bacterium]|nr:polynucleotide adenylyltransferase PcnB [Betaproteobacteria bacterium]
MIKKLIGRVLSGKIFKPRTPRAQVIPFKSHGVAREQISKCALSVTDTLQAKGFAAFVAGGAVRDLLLKRAPKDFDVATNATPEEVRALFRRSRIIGRRFQIVHVMCGRETVEVSTFRAGHDEEDRENGNAKADEHGRLLRDNVFGNQQQDATRRDLSINALFYDPATQTVHDYHGGVADLHKKRLRMIGDPVTRYREDPVRMLRVARFAGALDFEIDPATRQPIKELADLLSNVPPARLFDEMLKLLLSGHAVETVKRLRKEGLHHGLLPMLDVILEQPLGERFVMLALKNTDIRIRGDKGVSPAFLFATLLWHEVLAAWKVIEAEGVPPIPALYRAMDQVLQQQAEKLAIPRRYGGDMKEIWALQPRFDQRAGRGPYRLLELPRFRAGYDFLLLRCESGELDQEIGQWWTRFQDANADEREQMLLPESAGPKKRRRRRKRKPGDATAPAAAQEAPQP